MPRHLIPTGSALLFLVPFLLVPINGHAQGRVEIAGYGGYQFWGGIEGFSQTGVPTEFCIKDAGNWGGAIGYRVEENIRFELSYLNQSTTITARNIATGTTSDLFDVTIQYIQAGAMYEAPTAGRRLTPYGGLTIGLVNFNPDLGGISSEWRLSFGLNGGLKVYLGESFGLRGQTSLLIPVLWTSGGIFCGTGG
ncbi:MAG: porin family protein, partial [Ignavibacteria bacterium]|nr:porin family protein [Ignavibacteria bacterium]